MNLSKRMEAVAAMVSTGNVLADVGTDHGYIPIALVQRGRIPSAIAMDLREGPLEHAKEHIISAGLQDCIMTRLSDGVAALSQGEAESIVIAGMGGELVIHILRDGEAVCKAAKELILQPQSELAKVRRFLRENGYHIADEDMVLEDGKFYPMMRVEPSLNSGEAHDGTFCTGMTQDVMTRGAESAITEETALCDIYGPLLLLGKHPVLLLFLEKEQRQQEEILAQLMAQPVSDKLSGRIRKVKEKLAYNKKAQEMMR